MLTCAVLRRRPIFFFLFLTLTLSLHSFLVRPGTASAILSQRSPSPCQEGGKDLRPASNAFCSAVVQRDAAGGAAAVGVAVEPVGEDTAARAAVFPEVRGVAVAGGAAAGTSAGAVGAFFFDFVFEPAPTAAAAAMASADDVLVSSDTATTGGTSPSMSYLTEGASVIS